MQVSSHKIQTGTSLQCTLLFDKQPNTKSNQLIPASHPSSKKVDMTQPLPKREKEVTSPNHIPKEQQNESCGTKLIL